MPGLGPALKAKAYELRSALAGAGVPATLEPGDVQEGGAWVQFVTVTPLTMDQGWTARFYVYLVAPAVDTVQAFDVLGEVLDKALTVLEPDEPITAPGITLPHTPNQILPAYRLVVDELIDAKE